MRGFRVGIVKPGTPFGRDVREALEEGGLPVIELKLFEAEAAGEATLSHFGEEVVVTQPLDQDLLPRLDALFVGGGGTSTFNRVAREAAEQGVWTFVQGAIELEGRVIDPKAPEITEEDRLGIVPRPESHLLAATLEKLHRAYGVERAVANVLVPAQSRGIAGAEELHQQVVSLLNFKPLPSVVFEEQLAFNATLPDAGDTAESVRHETVRLAGLPDVLAVSLVQVPVFHAYCATLWVELGKAVEPKGLEAHFRETPFSTEKKRRSDRHASPVAVAESNRMHVRPMQLRSKGASRSYWLWLVADSSFYSPAQAALTVARRALE